MSPRNLDFADLSAEAYPFDVIGLTATGDEVWRKHITEPPPDGSLEIPETPSDGRIDVYWLQEEYAQTFWSGL